MARKILIISAMFFEIENLLKELDKFKISKMQINFHNDNFNKKHDDVDKFDKYAGKNILQKFSAFVFKKNEIDLKIFVFFTGSGEKNSLKNLENFLKFYKNNLENDFNFEKIFLVGLVGAMKKELKAGDIIEPNLIIYDSETIEIKNKKDEIALLTFKETANINIKYELLKKNKIDNLAAIDMETFHWLKKLSEFENSINLKNINVVKAISDELNYKFPEIFVNCDKKLKSQILGIIFENKKISCKFLCILLKFFRYNLLKTLKEVKQIKIMRHNFCFAREKLTQFILKKIF